jgi:membrane protease YdiL (CAAX protease family)
MWKRLYRVVVTESWAAMEAPVRAPGQAGTGRRSPTFKAAVALLVGALMLTGLNFIVLGGAWQQAFQDAAWDLALGLPDGTAKDILLSFAPLYRHAAWTLGCVTFYFLLPALVVKGVFRERLRDHGLAWRGFVAHLPVYLLLLAPVLGCVVVASFSPAFQETYPFYRNPRGWGDLLAWESLYVLQFFSLEFFFRGFWLQSTKERLGALAVPAMVGPYVMIHFTKPAPEAIGALVAGTVLGVLALRTGTIWGGVFVHASVAVSMDLASLFQRGLLPFQ